MRGSAIGLLLVAVGCSQAGCGFTRVGANGPDGSIDGPISEDAGEEAPDMSVAREVDAAMPPDLLSPAADGATTCGCGCAPTLLVSVTNRVSNSDVGGSVRRYARTA